MDRKKTVSESSLDPAADGRLEALRARVRELEEELRDLRAGMGAGDLSAREALVNEAEKVAHLGSWFLDIATNEVKWSEELYRILGYDPARDEGTAERFFQALHPQDLPRALEIMKTLADTGVMVPADYRVVRSDGSVREIQCNGTVVRDGQGGISRVVGTVLDITERKRLEEQLRQSQKMEVVGRVAGGVAHDFNNLLTVITGNADLILEERRDERLLRIREAAEVGAALTRQLLAFSRQAIVKTAPMDLNAAVRGMIRVVERLIGEDITVKLELAGKSPVILADRGQVQQILLNLAVNARDAMARGGELSFSTREVPGNPLGGGGEPARWVELVVRDTGRGMDASTRERAMEPFFTTKEPGKGTGLGLSTIADVVSQMKGAIDLRSEPDRGTAVTIRFPQCSLEMEPPPQDPEARRGAETILLVEDNSELRELVRLFLAGAGYQVLAVGRPGEAESLWKTRGGGVDLLIADMVMPEKSGRELSESLKAMKPGLKVLFISGYSPAGIGEGGFLQKPFTRLELLDTVRALCDNTRPARPD